MKNAADVLNHKRGTQTQLTELFVGMARAAGLKAYFMYVPDRSVEFFTPAWLSSLTTSRPKSPPSSPSTKAVTGTAKTARSADGGTCKTKQACTRASYLMAIPTAMEKARQLVVEPSMPTTRSLTMATPSRCRPVVLGTA